MNKGQIQVSDGDIAVPPQPSTPVRLRDERIDVMRGLALLMIFVDHIPDNRLSAVTLHAFGFCDAAEVFVLLAGFASMLAYGRSMQRDGTRAGIARIGRRVATIYAAHIGLLLATMAIVRGWGDIYGVVPKAVQPILSSPVNGLVQAVTLTALPTYLDILPLYIVLLAMFPVLWLGFRRSPAVTLAASGALWAVTQAWPALDLPNVLDTSKGWYFNPFAWQFLFTLGSALALVAQRHGGGLPVRRWLRAGAFGYLAVAFVMSFPWANWGLPGLMGLHVEPWTKTTLALPRILDILALVYIVLSSPRIRLLANSPVLAGARACGRHSLAIFVLGCTLAVFGRLVFRTFGDPLTTQAAVDMGGLAAMVAVGLMLEHQRTRGDRPCQSSAVAKA